MDIFFLKLNYIFAYLALLLIPIVFIVLLASMRSQRGKTTEKRMNPRLKGFIILLGAYTVVYIAINSLLRVAAARQFYYFAQMPVQGIEFKNRQAIIVKDKYAIIAFFNIIKSAKTVSAHHSHPVDRLEVTFPEAASYSYYIAKDSSVKDEFWFEWYSRDGIPVNADTGITIKQFRSKSMTEWLGRYGLI